MQQLKLDFSRPVNPVEDEKKTELISFRVGEKFKTDLEMIAQAKGIDMSKLLFEYAIFGFSEDYKNVLLQQVHHDLTLSEILKR